MYIDKRKIENPKFSICIPQYNRTSFLLIALEEIFKQEFTDYEICISDDCSTDGRENEVIKLLDSKNISYVYKKQKNNLKYDGNIRESISLAKGKYCFLYGNDDCLTNDQTLKVLSEQLSNYNFPDVVITNYEDYVTGKVNRRITKDRIIGTGPETAVNQFRNLSFVSGLIIDREKAQLIQTEKWDGFEMYQMYIISKIIASGGTVLGLDLSTIRKDIHIENEEVDRYSTDPKVDPCPIVERKVTTVNFGRLVVDAISEYLPDRDRNMLIFDVFFQLYMFTYSFWLFEYRRVQSWKFAAGIALGFRPRNVIGNVKLDTARLYSLKIIYLLITIIGLTVPVRIFHFLHPILYKISRLFYIGK